jgi:phosphoribosylaminoimidazole-succinocarboxamide synthase
MIDKKIIVDNLNNTLLETSFGTLGTLYKGKVRDNYINTKKHERVIIATDRLSAFDKVITTLPFKGQLLNEMSMFWFEKTKDLVPNHIIKVPDPNVCIVKECKPFPIEIVMRSYITGSAWRDYEKGKKISGIELPKGLKKNQKLDKVIISPSTKAEKGLHDEPISREEILDKKIVDKTQYEQVEKYAIALFDFGQKLCAKNNLILVDCKYEFGITSDNKIIVIDEMHTPDASRFWVLDTYNKKFSSGQEPDILDKEFFRTWLMDHGFSGEGSIPKIPDDVRVELAQRYIQSYDIITGTQFKPYTEGKILERIKKNLKIKN